MDATTTRRDVTRREFLAGIGAAAAAARVGRGLCAQTQPGGSGDRPRNVVFIFADDVGWGDLGCYGAKKIRTPNLDRLAARGVRFTDFHVADPVCSASRYSLLTGEYSFRTMQDATFRRSVGVLGPTSPLCLRLDRPTLAGVMKRAGYATGVVGKWHLGLGKAGVGPDYNGELKPGPLEVGFEWFYGFGSTNDRTPCVYIEDHRVVGLEAKDPISVDPKAPGATRVINNIRRHTWQAGGKAACWKDEEMAGVFTAKCCQFITKNRDRPFFLYYAPHNVHHPAIPARRFWGSSEAGPRGDSMQELDWSVGEILRTLDDLHLADETLVIFTSDNGAAIDNQFRTPEWDKLYPADKEKDHPFNGPWRGGKYGPYEGGHRMPCVLRWPKRVAGGRVCDSLIGAVDMIATFAAMTGQNLSGGAACDSMNMLPALLDGKAGRDWLYSSGSIREGPWKLVRKQLYNLADDPGETKDLAARHADAAARLQARLDALRKAPAAGP